LSATTQPIFIIGTGRSGSRSMFKMLSGVPGVEIYHEFVCTHVQKLACLYFMNKISHEAAKQELMTLHGAGIHYSEADLWIDSSNKLSWLIQPLAELFPKAKFLNIVRDGRKVAGSFFYKLAAEIYDDRSTAALTQWLADPSAVPVPPPEKKYWWNIPQPGQPFHDAFPGYSQFERICYHWQECNRVVRDGLAPLPDAQKLTVRLEDITKDPEILAQMIRFIGLDYQDDYFDYLQTPQNVFFPMDFKIAGPQLAAFEAICTPMMRELGYDGTELYDVKY